jgi:hypothetical protein
MSTTIDKLRTVCRRCLDDSDDQLRWLGRSLHEFLTHRCRSVDEALGLQTGRGGIPWWREEANRKRDAALRELAARHFSGLSVTAQARQVHVLAVRYAASRWRFDRTRTTMPPSYAGGTHEWLWLAFSSGAPMPIGERQLRNILPPADSSGRKGRVSVGPALGPVEDLVGLGAGA